MSGPGRGPARHELPEIDESALRVAALAERLHAAAADGGIARWERYLAPLPGIFRDGDLRDVRAAVRTSRAAFGPKDSIADALPTALCAAFRDAIDDLARRLARLDAHRGA